MVDSVGLRSMDSIISVMPMLRAQRSAVRIPARARDIFPSFKHRDQPHPASYSEGIELLSGEKVARE
jgi:hypothetical protein